MKVLIQFIFIYLLFQTIALAKEDPKGLIYLDAKLYCINGVVWQSLNGVNFIPFPNYILQLSCEDYVNQVIKKK